MKFIKTLKKVGRKFKKAVTALSKMYRTPFDRKRLGQGRGDQECDDPPESLPQDVDVSTSNYMAMARAGGGRAERETVAVVRPYYPRLPPQEAAIYEEITSPVQRPIVRGRPRGSFQSEASTADSDETTSTSKDLEEQPAKSSSSKSSKSDESSGKSRSDLQTRWERKVKKGTAGTPVHIVSNHYELKWSGEQGNSIQIHQFRITFIPDSASLKARHKLISKGRLQYHGAYIFDGGNELFCNKKFTENVLQLDPVVDNEVEYTVVLKYTKLVPEDQPIYLQFYNLIVRKCLYGMGLDEIGGNYFDTATATTIKLPVADLQLWPGFIANMKPCEKGLLLCVDVTYKVVRKDDLLTRINQLRARYRPGCDQSLSEYILDDIRGLNIVTPYNRKTYKVIGIEMEMNPLSTFPVNDTTISFVTYLQEKHSISISDLKQPMIRAKVSAKERRMKGLILLVPEHCVMTGLTEEMRGNMGIMKEISKYLHMDPRDRMFAVKKFISRLDGTPKCKEILAEWGFTFETKLMECSVGRVLPPENIIFAGDKTFTADDKGDWTRALRSNQMLSCVKLTQWIVLVHTRVEQDAKKFVNTMVQVAKPLGFIISPPKSIEKVDDIRLHSYIRYVEGVLQRYPKNYLQMVMCILPNNKSDLYYALKKRLTQDMGVLSQCLLQKNLTSKAAMSIATKLVVQMNTKLGGEPWTVQIPSKLKERSLVIGFDFYKKTGGKGIKVGGLVGSVCNDFSRYFSSVFHFIENLDLLENMQLGLIKCIDTYTVLNGAPPMAIIFYRAGMEEGMVTTGVVEKEAISLENAIHEWYENKEEPQYDFTYVLVTKQNNARLMGHKGSCKEVAITPPQLTNPPPGTVLDKDIVAQDGKYKEFYLCPTTARQGTIRPIQYRVIFDSSSINPDILQAFTYKMCHLYYNWSGTVNVPSVCQYAGKLSKQSAQALPNFPNSLLSYNLHYL